MGLLSSVPAGEKIISGGGRCFIVCIVSQIICYSRAKIYICAADLFAKEGASSLFSKALTMFKSRLTSVKFVQVHL